MVLVPEILDSLRSPDADVDDILFFVRLVDQNSLVPGVLDERGRPMLGLQNCGII